MVGDMTGGVVGALVGDLTGGVGVLLLLTI